MNSLAIRRTAAIILRQIYLMQGSLARILPLFVWVAIDIVLWGFITQYLNAVTNARFNFVTTLLGAVLLWDFCARVIHGVTTAFLEDVWARNFLNIFATPLSIGEYVTGLVITSAAGSAIGLLVMFGLASAVFGLSFFADGLVIVPFVLVLFLFGIALGIGACALVLWLGPASEFLVWPIPAVIAPFVGVFYPIATLPRWMQDLSLLLPPSPVFEAMRHVVAHEGVSALTLVWGGGLALAYVSLACWCFAVTYRRAIRVGLIARYSAENLS